MRWVIVAALLAGVGCKKSDKQGSPPPSAVEDAAPVAATDAAPPPATMDAGAVPPPAPGLVAFTGSYDIAFELPKKYKCEDDAAKVEPKQTFDVSIDRANDDELVVAGLDGGWEVSESVDVNDEGRMYLQLGNKADVDVEQFFILRVDGTQVTGTVDVRPKYPDVDPVCTPFLDHVKVTGTRTPKP